MLTNLIVREIIVKEDCILEYSLSGSSDEESIVINNFFNEPIWQCYWLGDGNKLLAVEYLSLNKESNYYGIVTSDGRLITKGINTIFERDKETYVLGLPEFGNYSFLLKSNGNLILIRSDNGLYFENGLADICYQNKWGIINTDGNIIISEKYDFITNFAESKCIGYVDNEFHLLNDHGVLILKFNIFQIDKIIEDFGINCSLLNFISGESSLYSLFNKIYQ